MSSETELKFRIPSHRLAALRRAVATAGAVVEPLAAAYFDTAGEHLAQARVALRLRREGPQWVQTLKAEGALALQRLEDNVVVASADGSRPALDLARHAGSPAGAVLARVLAAAPGAALTERYATDLQRTRRQLRQGGALVELALDEGCIRAAGASCPVCEIEFELLQGPPQALLALAGRWVERFGLVLDTRSKSERGHWLALGRATSPPTRARPLVLARRGGVDAALAAMLANPLGQVLANASVLADPDWRAEATAGPAAAPLPAADPEHLHQLRVGLRRLRSVLQVYRPLLPAPVLALAPALATLFGQLGAARDRDALADWLWPALRQAGAPFTGCGAASDADPAERPVAALLATPAVQQLWLALLDACLQGQPAAAADGAPPVAGTAPVTAPSTALTTAPTTAPIASITPVTASPALLRETLRQPLLGLLRQVQRDGARFGALDDAARHRLRRRVKRLRYTAELSASLWPAKALARLLRRLEQVQAPLGLFNDCVVAQAQCRALAETDGRAWFAVGWLAARRQALEPDCAAALAGLAGQRIGLGRRR